MANILSDSFKILLNILDCDECAVKKGNPYNTSLSVEIFSDRFYGNTNFLVNYNDLILFYRKIEDMYNTLVGEASIKDYDFGSYLNVECDDIGKFVFKGVLISESFQELKFLNKIDQTYLKDFLNDFSEEIERINI
ncbi:MAG: hypothetical protein ACI35W_00875 [Anaeroplasmataceae bacterium]